MKQRCLLAIKGFDFCFYSKEGGLYEGNFEIIGVTG